MMGCSYGRTYLLNINIDEVARFKTQMCVFTLLMTRERLTLLMMDDCV